MDATHQVLTPKDLPKHHAVGRCFFGWDQQVYYCDSYDPRCDYWMTNVLDATDRRAVSPRAIGGTFHTVWDSYKPTSPSDVEGRVFRMVDLRVPAEQFTAVLIEEKDCLALDDKQILFFWPEDADKFVKKVKDAAVRRATDTPALAL